MVLNDLSLHTRNKKNIRSHNNNQKVLHFMLEEIYTIIIQHIFTQKYKLNYYCPTSSYISKSVLSYHHVVLRYKAGFWSSVLFEQRKSMSDRYCCNIIGSIINLNDWCSLHFLCKFETIYSCTQFCGQFIFVNYRKQMIFL